MDKIIGVHFRDGKDGKIDLCFCEDDSISTGTINIPEDIKKMAVLKVDTAFKRAFEIVNAFISQQTGFDSYKFIICVPDSYGITELTAINKMARDFGIRIDRTITETMALAFQAKYEFGINENVITSYISGRTIGVAEYDLYSNTVTKTDTYIAGIWNTSSIEKTKFAHSYSKRMFDRTESFMMFFTGTMSDCMKFDQAISDYIKRSNDFINKDIEITMLSNSDLIEGLGYICGKVEGLPAFEAIRYKDLLTPYKLIVSVNGEMYPVFDENVTVPVEDEIELRRIAEPEKPYTDIFIHEEKENKFDKICSLRIPKSKLEGFYNKLIQVKVRADEGKNLTFVLYDMENDKQIEIPLTNSFTEPEIPTEESMSVEGLIKKFLPIVDNLEYAVKFSQDKENPYYQGINQTYQKAVNILNQNGIEQITGEGEPFDYTKQNAVAHVDDESLPESTVKEVMQTGYSYKGKVIRTASVTVAN